MLCENTSCLADLHQGRATLERSLDSSNPINFASSFEIRRSLYCDERLEISWQNGLRYLNNNVGPSAFAGDGP